MLLAAGLCSSTIRDIPPCIAQPDIRTPWLAGRLRVELGRVEEQIDQLQRVRTVLSDLTEEYMVR